MHTRALLFATLAAIPSSFAQQESPAPLPAGVKVVWNLDQAQRDKTPTRERICLNGLWRWQPAEARAAQVPAGRWGYFKVPGSWPGLTDYMQKDSQTVFAHADWKEQKLGGLNAAWYQREFTVPPAWSGRRIALRLEYLNSYAAVFVDGQPAGELRFPAGELDLTSACRPGAPHVLSLLVVSLPLKGVALSYTDSAAAREVKGAVARRGLCGDAYLVSEPVGPRLVATRTDTSVRQRQFTFGATLTNLMADTSFALRARIIEGDRTVRDVKSRTFRAGDLTDGRIEFTESWMPEKLWDIHTPQNVYGLELSLLDAAGQVLDVHWTTRLGFREFWSEGRDFFLNGTRLHLSAVPLDNAQVGAALSTYAAARESLERLRSFGINFVYTHNYDCNPGSHLSFAEILRAADDVGMLVALTQPHFSHYEWKSADADATNGYTGHAAFYARVAQAHPSVVMYSMSHNATGYEEDMNPDLIDGVHDPRDTWSARNAKVALRAEAIVRRLDPGRIVYHHASGNLGSMHAINFYPNFVPIQEMSDWFGHWATEGVKPVFLCEYGAPFTWDWTMYRGWYQGQREFGSAKVPWEFCLAEWNAPLLGDAAYGVSEAEKANLRWEAKQFRAGHLWHRWDYPNSVGSSRFDERYPVFARYLTDNGRAFRTWGVSATSPWEHEHFWKLREGVDKRREEFPVDWEHLQRPGFSPDYSEQRYERMDLAFARTDWIPTPAAQALLRNNRPLLAYLGGKPARFTSKDHAYFPGEFVDKQLIVINDSREPITGEAEWSFDLPDPLRGKVPLTVPPGGQERVPVRLELPRTPTPGRYELSVRFGFSNGETQTDTFAVQVMPRPPAQRLTERIALFDPRGETTALLRRMGVPFEAVDATADLARFGILVVGKAALTLTNPAPDIARVRDGLKVLMFEQTAAVLERRFGFRVTEYGLRQVFPRVPGHPALAGITAELWQDWRGEATLLASRLQYTLRPRYGPTVNWCDIPVPRLWRCGNYGSVASVLIEKPARGDFLALLDGGFALQYSPLLELHEGRGMILFCQVDVTGRTEPDPVAATLLRNILRHVSEWKPQPARTLAYVGDATGRRHLESAGFTVESYAPAKLSSHQVLLVGPGAGRNLAQDKPAIAAWLQDGGHLLALGQDQKDADAFLPIQLAFSKSEHIAALFRSTDTGSLLQGIGPADVHNRDPRELPLVASGVTRLGNGVLGTATNLNVTFCQLVPWEFGPTNQSNLKRTFRRASFTLTRLLGNLGVQGTSPVAARFREPVDAAKPEKRWLDGLYLDAPEEWDDPYRFFRW